jgi:hypothetical protein
VQIQPMIQTPIHGAFPSGHCTEAHAVARVLYELVQTAGATAAALTRLREQLMRQAARIAINRTIAGVHYPIDSMAGQMLGLSVAEYFIARCHAPGNTTNVDAWQFNAENYIGTDDFTGRELFDPAGNRRSGGAAGSYYANAVVAGNNPVVARVRSSALLYWLWRQAKAEWP